MSRLVTRSPRVLICGSINMDLVVRTPLLPSPGQTRMARSMEEVSGGKGANQAVAAARLGADVRILGCVGSDAFAATLQDNLAREKINTQWIRRVPSPSGVAIVAVDDSGENSIMVVPGANGWVSPTQIDDSIEAIEWADWIVLQLEIPMDTVKHAIARAKLAGKRVVLNPAPVPSEWDPELLQVDLLCPNQSEAEAILGIKIASIDDARAAAIALRQRGAHQVVITLGSQGAVASDSTNDTTTWIRPIEVRAVDTTAAGDAFIGALATRLASGDSLLESCAYAAAAAAYAVTIAGAQPSLPTQDDIQVILESRTS